jgi:hypothetical protein
MIPHLDETEGFCGYEFIRTSPDRAKNSTQFALLTRNGTNEFVPTVNIKIDDKPLAFS